MDGGTRLAPRRLSGLDSIPEVQRKHSPGFIKLELPDLLRNRTAPVIYLELDIHIPPFSAALRIFPDLDLLADRRAVHNAARSIRTLASFAPPRPATCVYSPSTPVASPAGPTTTVAGVWKPVPTAAAATATTRGRPCREHVRPVWQLHKRPGSATGLPVWPVSFQAWPRIF